MATQNGKLRKGNTMDINQNMNTINNSSLVGFVPDNTHMFRSQPPQKDKLASSGQLNIRNDDNVIEQRPSFNELIQEKKKQEKEELEEQDENIILMNEKYSNKVTQISYGSSITISVAEYPTCYIYSDGFSSKTIKLKEFKSAQGSRELDFFNTVFMVLPSMEHKYQKQLLHQFVFPESKKQHGNEELSKRKQKIQSLQQNIDGELNANIQLFNKLKGTPVLFSTSSFHLVHKASLKYLSIDDTNQDSYNFKFVDFPDQNCLFKFLPCLMFQKQRSNTVYNKDNLFIVSSKPIHNRKPYIFSDYSGQSGINKIDVLQDESSYGKIYANLETQCKWRINLFSESETDDQKYTMNVGDSIWLNLSEQHFTISAIKTTNIHQKIKNNIYSVHDPQSNNLQSHASDTNLNKDQKNKSLLNSQLSPNTNQQQPPVQQNFNFQLGLSPANPSPSPSPLNQPNYIEKLYQNQSSLQGKITKQITLTQEFLTPHYQKTNTLQVEDPNANQHSISGSRVSRQLSGQSNSRDLDDEEDYDENLDVNIGALENEIFHIADVDFIPQNAEDDQNFMKKEDGQKLRQGASQYYKDEGQQTRQEENILEEEEDQNNGNEKNQNLNTQGLWKIESEFFVIGGPLEWKQNYRLRHFATGKYLTLEQNSNGNYQLRLTKKPTPQSLFNFSAIQSLQSQNDFSNFYRLKNVQTEFYIGIDQRNLMEQNKCQLKLSKEQSQYNIYKTKKANFDDTWETNFLLCCVPILTESIKFINRIGKKNVLERFMKNRQAFEQIFLKIKQVLKDIDAFICNTLISNISVTKEYSKSHQERANILREQHVLGILCLLLFKTFPREESLKYMNMETIQEKVAQEQNRNMITNNSFMTNQFNPSETGGFRKPLSKMMEDVILKKYSISILVYKIFQNVCFDNRQNQEYLYKFMSEFQKQVGSQDIVCESLIRFFKSNKMIIQTLSLPFQPRKPQKKYSRIGQNFTSGPSELKQAGSHLSAGEEKITHLNLIINKLIYYQQNKKSDILKLLTQFCKYIDQAIFHNQEMIFSNLITKFNNQKQQPMFVLNLQGGDNLTILVQNNYEEKLMPIAEFLQLDYKSDKEHNDDDIADEDQDPHSQDKLQVDNPVEYKYIESKNNNYLMNQLNLYANLCLNRNYNSCNYFMEIFPLKTLIDHVENDLIKNEYIKASFLKLIHYIYLDKEPRTIQVKPNFIRVIDQDFDYINNEIFNMERKRMASLTQREPTQTINIEMQPMLLQSQASRQNKMNQNNQDAVSQLERLEGKELLTGFSEQDTQELNSLKKLKTDLLQFLLQKEELLKKVSTDTQDKIFNVMTLEAVKILKMMLKFGIFNSELDAPAERFKNKTTKTFLQAKLDQMLKQKEEPKPKTEIEKLVDICVKILEYDQFYQETLQQLKITRRTEELKKPTNMIGNVMNMKLLQGGFSIIGTGLSGMKDLLDLAVGGGNKENKKEQTKKKQISNIEIGADIITDPLFKKVQGLKKVLNRYTNKTYLSKAELKKDQEEDYETEIKIQICQIFQELLNIQQDFYLDNTIQFFKKNFQQIKIRNPQQKLNLLSLLPDDPLEVGIPYENPEEFVNYTEKQPPKTFDAILERSFMETLMISFYFADNSILSNEIMNLIRRICKQKDEMISNIDKIELLLTPESKKSYRILSLEVSRLKNLIQNSQIWLQITQNKESEMKMSQCLEVLKKIIAELTFKGYQDSEDIQQQMNTAQSIFKHIGGDETVIQLIERAMILFHSEKQAFFIQANLNEKISNIIKMVNDCYQILVLFCRNNSAHQVLFFNKIFRLLLLFQDFNFGQVPLIYEIIQGNVQICSQLKYEDLKSLADYIVNHGKYNQFLNFFDIILQTVSNKDDKQSKTIQALVMKILFEDRMASKINPFQNENEIEIIEQNQYQFFEEEPDMILYKEQLIRLMSKGLNRETDISLISKMNKIITADNLLEELYTLQTESIQYERSQDKQHLTPLSYKKQKKILKILLFYFTKSQKDYIESQLRGNKFLLQFIHLVTGRLKQDRLYPIKFQIQLIDRVIPLINIYSELFLKDLNISLTESQDNLAMTKASFQQFANEYIRQADQFHREYEPIFTKEIRFRHLLKLSIFYSIPIPKSLGGVKNFFQTEGKIMPNNDTDFGYLEARNNDSRIESTSSFNTKRQNTYLFQQSKRMGSVTERSKQALENEDDLSIEGDKLKKKQSLFNNSLLKGKKNGEKGSPLLQNSPSGQKHLDKKDIDIEMINLNSSPEKIMNEDDIHGIEKTNSNRMSNNKLITLQKHTTSVKQHDQQTMNSQIQENWDYIKTLLETDDDIQERLEEEKSYLSNNILNVQNIFMADLKDHQKDILLNSEDLLVKCLAYIEFWQANHSDKEDVIFIIKSLSNLLKLDESEEDIQIERQCMLDRLNATKICLLLISDDSIETDNDLLYYLIKLIILILDGGNPVVQKTIYDFFLSSNYSEKFFSKINNMINDQIIQETTGQQYITGLKGDKIVEKILRLLQLFCEGHNNNLQNYMRIQLNNKKSYDFITLVIKLLSTYKIHNENFDTVVQCFDTLTEFIQGPCQGNQTSILSSKFLDYAVLILSGDKKILDLQLLQQQQFEEANKDKKNASSQIKKSEMGESKLDKNSKGQPSVKEQKIIKAEEADKKDNDLVHTDQQDESQYDIALHPGKLARLKHKCLITIVSLLECNINSQEFVTKIMRTIPLNVLTNNLSRIYELYQKYEKDYVEAIFNRADEEIDPKKPEEYSELIIENGFNLYILVNLFLENKKAIDDEDDEIKEFFDEFAKEEEEGGLMGLLKNNILGDLSKVGTAFLGLGMGALKDIYNKATNQADQTQLDEQQKKINEMEKKELRKNAIKFFKKQVARIEIVRDGQLQFIYFPVLPFCKMMPEEVNEDFRENVKRTSTKTKLASLMGRSYYMIKVMKHEERLRLIFDNNKALGFLAQNIKSWEKIAYIIACAINIIILFSYSEFYVTSEDKLNKTAYQRGRLFDPRLFYISNQTNTEQYIITLGIVNIAFYSIVVAVFLMKKAPILIGDIWEQYYKLYTVKDKKEKKKKNKGGIPLELVGALTTHAFDLVNKILLFVLNALKSVIIMLQDYEIVYYTFNMAIVIFGLTVHPFLFVGCMTDLLRTKELKNVVSAIWKPKSEILLLLVLFIIFQYYFTLFAYIYFNDHFSDNKCESLWRCFVTVFDLTFKQNGGVGTSMMEPQSLAEYLKEQNTDVDNVVFKGTLEMFTQIYFLRFIFDNLTNIVLIFILINILKGIIVDKFRSLKDEVQFREYDEKYFCFVCGISREILDKAQEKKGYIYHIRSEHYMWNYVYYRAYLEFKESTEYNGDESYVRDKIDESDLGWFPVKRTWSVQQKEDQELHNTHTNVIENLKEINEKLKDTQMKFLSTIEQVTNLQPDDEDLYESQSLN